MNYNSAFLFHYLQYVYRYLIPCHNKRSSIIKITIEDLLLHRFQKK